MVSTIVICASSSAFKEAEEWKEKLYKDGYIVRKSVENIEKNIPAYIECHTKHYEEIEYADILFVLNLDKNGIKNYIGASVFAEIAYAIALKNVHNRMINIYCLNPIPDGLPYSEELKLWEKIGWIKQWKGKSMKWDDGVIPVLSKSKR